MEFPEGNVHRDDRSYSRLIVSFGVFLVVFIWWNFRNIKRLRPQGRSYDCQSIQNKNGAWERAVTGPLEKLGFECPTTMDAYLRRGLDMSGDGPCLGWRENKTAPYSWLTYSQVIDKCTNFGAGLVHLGLVPGTEAYIGIFARTCKEWVISEHAAYLYSLVVVPLYDSLGPDALQAGINRLKVSLLVCGEEKNFETLRSGKDQLKHLKDVIFMESVSDKVRREAHDAGIKVYDFEEIVEMGRRNPSILHPAKPDDVGILMFTSGTTGEPKATMLTHRSVCKTVENCIKSYLPRRLYPHNVAFGYLPLAHVMERIMELGVFVHGGRVGFNSSGIANLLDDIQTLKPDVLVVVPRVLNRIYGRMQDAIRGSTLKTLLFNLAVFCKSIEMHFGYFRTNSIWDMLIFGKIQKLLGGRVSLVATGSAPQDARMTTVMKAALGCYIHEAYGQTETSGVMTISLPGDPLGGHVGCPIEDMEIKLVDVPELGYFAKNGQGEICGRGPANMLGYHGMPEKTAEVIDEDGFVHSGDIGQWITGGRLKIIDRKKHIFKLSHGEYVAPERVEAELLVSLCFSQIFVDGNGLYPFTVALVYPNYDVLPERFRANAQQGAGDAKPNTKELEVFLLDEMNRIGKSQKLKSYEIPKKLFFLAEPFSLENGFMTPTQKIKRELVRSAFKQQLAGLYKNVSLTDH